MVLAVAAAVQAVIGSMAAAIMAVPAAVAAVALRVETEVRAAALAGLPSHWHFLATVAPN